MIRKLILAGAMALSGAAALAPAVDAQRYYSAPTYGYGYGDRGGYDRVYDDRGYDSRYRGYDQRDRRPRGCSNGTAGTIIGAIAGGLLGRTIDTRGDRTLGTVLGAGGGAVLGHAIERSGNGGYCR